MISLSNYTQERCTEINEPIDLVKELKLHNQESSKPVTQRDLETERYLGGLIYFYERSPPRTSSLRKKRNSKRKHRKSSDDVYGRFNP
jgi:hypothetical protein